MRSVNFPIFIILCICFLQTNSSAQPKLWDIYTISDQPFINIIVDKYESDSLTIKSLDQTFIVHQDSIKLIIQRKGSKVGIGIIAGSILGITLANLTYRENENDFIKLGGFFSSIYGFLIGGLAGGIFGGVISADTEYQFSTLNSEQKRILLGRLFKPEN